MPAIGIPAVYDLDALDAASGIVFTGTRIDDYSGVTITSVGDVNADSFDDLLLGLYWGTEAETFEAEAFVVFGSARGPATIDLGALTAVTGVTITGMTATQIDGEWLAGGDNRGDVGQSTILIGAAPDFGAYVVYGFAGMDSAIDVTTDLTGIPGKPITGFADSGDTGQRIVAVGGDYNGDDLSDFLFGSPSEDPSRAYVVFSPTDFQSPGVDVSTLDGTNGFSIEGIGPSDATGVSIENAGDINGDGRADIVVGAFAASDYAGAAYVIFGQQTWDATFDVADLDGGNGFRIAGLDHAGFLGVSVASAGDLNGDGYDDVVVSAPGADSGRGEVYVVFGRASGFAAEIDLSTLDGSNGFKVDGSAIGNNFGWSVAGIGDFDGDGIDDLAISSKSGPDGSVYVVLGQGTFGVGSIQLAELTGADRDSGLGFRIDGAAGSGEIGSRVEAAGDVNNDGFADLAISTFGAGEGNGPGAAYLLYGRLPATSVARYGTEIGQAIQGSGGADSLFGRGGADELYGGNGSDNLIGGDGNDLLEGGNGMDRLRGSAGDDILHGGAGDDRLEGGAGTNVLEGGEGNDTYILGFGTNIVFDTGGLYDVVIAATSIDLDDYAGSGIERYSLVRNHAGGTISGTDGNDVFSASGWIVTLDGEDGDDRLTGADGSSEIFIGGLGTDYMSSGPKDFDDPWLGQLSGRDTFVFRDVVETAVGEARDVIDWFADDWIDLRQIDANTGRTGNQAFSFISGPFTGTAGELRVEFVPGADRDTQYNLVSGDVDGDGLADFEIEVHMQVMTHTLTSSDFFL
jgi:hypothetical protein